jgi:hypothetical protein
MGTARSVGLCACATNWGILVFNAGFTNAEALAAPNPAMFSPFGQLMVLVWGLAFAAAGLSEDASPAVWAVFALEKLCYVAGFVHWHSTQDHYKQLKWTEAVFSWEMTSDPTPLLAPVFHHIYGFLDAMYLLLFLYLACIPRPKGSGARGQKGD